MKILMVCLGNICRSPLAEGILKDKAKKAGLNWEVDSAGTGNYHVGEPPHVLSQKIAKQNNIDISKQMCRQFKKEDVLQFDKIYAMDNEVYADIKKMSGNLWDEKKTDLLMNEAFPGENMDIPDPWYGTEINYQVVFEMVSKACDAIIKKASPNPSGGGAFKTLKKNEISKLFSSENPPPPGELEGAL